jgi:acyl carrier protein
MTSHEFLQILRENNGWDITSITNDSRIEDAVSWDSMAILGFLAASDKHLNINANADEVIAANTIGELFSLIAGGLTDRLAA